MHSKIHQITFLFLLFLSSTIVNAQEFNVLECSYGSKAACDESLLSDMEKIEVQETRSRMNALNCSYGTGANCNESALTDYQVVEVQETRSRMNALKCLYGSGDNCNSSLSNTSNTKGIDRTKSLFNYFDEAPERLGCAENGSCHGDISEATLKPKTVHVEGYYRSDGTYVRGHYRSK